MINLQAIKELPRILIDWTNNWILLQVKWIIALIKLNSLASGWMYFMHFGCIFYWIDICFVINLVYLLCRVWEGHQYPKNAFQVNFRVKQESLQDWCCGSTIEQHVISIFKYISISLCIFYTFMHISTTLIPFTLYIFSLNVGTLEDHLEHEWALFWLNFENFLKLSSHASSSSGQEERISVTDHCSSDIDKCLNMHFLYIIFTTSSMKFHMFNTKLVQNCIL